MKTPAFLEAICGKLCITPEQTRHWLWLLVITGLLGSAQGQDIRSRVDSLNEAAYELRVSDRTQSMQLAKLAIQLSEGRYQRGLHKAYLNLGINYTNLSRFDSAMILLRTSEAYFKESLDAALVQYYLGINFSNLRDFDKALLHFSTAISSFQEIGNKKYEAFVENSLGIVYGRQADYDVALGHFLKAYEIKLAEGLPYDEELANISIVYRLMGKPAKALEFAKLSLQMCKDLKDTLGIAQTSISVGKIFQNMADADSAIWYYDSALELSRSQNFYHQVASAMINKADLLNSLGAQDEALQLLLQVLDIPDNVESLESVYEKLASSYMLAGDFQKALNFGQKAYYTAKSNKSLSLIANSAKLIAEVHAQMNRLDSSNHYLALYAEHLDELNTRTNESEVSDLRVRIETLEKDHEISLLRKENELEELRRQRLRLYLISLSLAGIILVSVILLLYRRKLRRQREEKSELQKEIEKGKSDLYKQTLHMIHINNCLNDIEEEVNKRQGPEAVNSNKRILQTIKLNKSLDRDWQNFNEYFGNVHASFYNKLADASGLSTHDRRVCALLKLGLSNREMATILNIEVKSVAMVKYRIKKKLNLEEEVDLLQHIQSL